MVGSLGGKGGWRANHEGMNPTKDRRFSEEQVFGVFQVSSSETPVTRGHQRHLSLIQPTAEGEGGIPGTESWDCPSMVLFIPAHAGVSIL